MWVVGVLVVVLVAVVVGHTIEADVVRQRLRIGVVGRQLQASRRTQTIHRLQTVIVARRLRLRDLHDTACADDVVEGTRRIRRRLLVAVERVGQMVSDNTDVAKLHRGVLADLVLRRKAELLHDRRLQILRPHVERRCWDLRSGKTVCRVKNNTGIIAIACTVRATPFASKSV